MTAGISNDHAVCHGKPVIEGTRVLVSTILGALAGGDSRQEVAEDYGITIEQISSAKDWCSHPHHRSRFLSYFGQAVS